MQVSLKSVQICFYSKELLCDKVKLKQAQHIYLREIVSYITTK